MHFSLPFRTFILWGIFCNWLSNAAIAQALRPEVFFTADFEIPKGHKLLDVDQDGDLDYVFTKGTSPFANLWWRANNGSGIFGDKQLLTIPTVNSFIGFDGADLDGDGATDIALYRNGSLWMAKHGSGASFLSPVLAIQNAVYSPENESLTDINGDGTIDFVSYGAICLNNGTGQFNPSILMSYSPYIEDYDIYDVDQDGLRDVIYCRTSGFSGAYTSELFWKRQSSPGVFEFQNISDTIKGAGLVKAYKEPVSGKVVIAVSKPQLLGIGMMDAGTTYFLERNNGGFTRIGYLNNWTQKRFIRHQSGAKEYLLDSHLSRIDRASNGCYPPGNWIDCWNNLEPLFFPTIQPARGDVDGNGYIDYVVDGRLWMSVDSLGIGKIRENIDTAFYGSPFHRVADINGDGNPDLLAVGGQQMVVFPGISGGTFGEPRTIAYSVDFADDNFPSGNTDAELQITDYNGDGMPDIFYGGPHFKTWHYFQNSGNFRFQRKIYPKLRFRTCSNCLVSNRFDWPIAPVPVKLNADSKPDLLCLFQGRYLGYSLQQGDTNTIFQPLIQDTVRLFDVADFNGDGLVDLVTLANNRIYWHRRTGNLTYAPKILVGMVPPTGTVGVSNFFLVAKDIDSDGDPDITFAGKANNAPYSIAMFYNQAGVFVQGPKASFARNTSYRFYLEDITGDGYADPMLDKALFLNHTQDSLQPPATFFKWGFTDAFDFSFYKNPSDGQLRLVLDSLVRKLGVLKNVQSKRQRIEGFLFTDKNQDCLQGSGELGLSQCLVRAEPGGFLAITNQNGRFAFQLPYGNYQVSPIIRQGSGLYIDSLCPSLSLSASIDSLQADTVRFGARLLACPQLKVKVHTPRRRMCARNQSQCEVWNDGSSSAFQKTVFMQLPRYVHMVEPGQWVWQPSDSTWRIVLDSIPAGKHFRFTWIDSVRCQENLLGLEQCTKVWITANPEVCVPSLPGWDRSVIRISSYCEVGGIQKYLVKNVGPGNMTTSRPWFKILGNAQVGTGNYQLASGDSLIIQPTVQGESLQMDMGENNPFNRWVSYRLNWNGSCNPLGGVASSVSPFAEQDQDCAIIRNSFDPNEKTTFPFNPQANTTWVRNGEVISYTLHFQNTGNDTAYSVLLVDTLAPHFEFASLETTGSSHPYQMYASGSSRRPVLHFQFNHINLPDSTTNRLGSCGFVSFKVKLKNNLPEHTNIINRAGIYFDQNQPIITNQTSHTIREQYQISSVQKVQLLEFALYPNPASQKVTMDFGRQVSGEFVIYSSLGSVVKTFLINRNESIEVPVSDLPTGFYLVQFKETQGSGANGKLHIQTR